MDEEGSCSVQGESSMVVCGRELFAGVLDDRLLTMRSDVCDELVTAHEERQEAIDFVEFSIEQIGETLQEFKDGEIWNPLHQVTQ